MKTVLVISHGQTYIEHFFNMRTVTSRRVHLSESSIDGLHPIKDAVKHNGKGHPHNVHITMPLLDCVRDVLKK